MVAGGVPNPRADHAEAVVALGLDMLAVVAGFAAERGLTIDVRLGVHTGTVVAGVIGRRKFAYDLWGDTVNVAARLESSGVAGRLQLSDATHARVAHRFAGQWRGDTALKGKGSLSTWLLPAAPTP